MWGIIIALISGALMSIQGVFNTELTKQSSLWVTTGFAQLTAFIVCLFAWLATGRQSVSAILNVQPKYMLLAGAVGAFITLTVIKGMDSLGPAKAVMIIVVAQIITAYIIEVFGLFGVEKTGFELKSVVGAALAIAGIVIFKW
ncbi:MAG: DMT family transporter [Lachnospiraceae bacterium]|nr:DMT family transporter [Lachnospiraceae bacterium]